VKVLITGISGGLGRLVATQLAARGDDVIGIDRRPWPDAPAGVTVIRTDVRKRPAEDVFRTQRPDAVVHLATVTHFTARSEERYRINLWGTKAVLHHCEAYDVGAAIFVGRHTIYGAAPDAPLYRNESEPPLAAATFPDLADLVAADLFASSAIWRFPKMRTSVLRMVYTLGPSRRGPLASYLSGARVPMVMGFDPLYQFMHERDAAAAIVAAVDARLEGVFNVTGPDPVPLSLLCEGTGRTAVPIPEPLFSRVLGRFGFPRLPPGSVDHIKYPIVVDGSAFQNATGFQPSCDEMQVMDGYRWL
jgi:UDP-glucose 4-epimerase